MSLKSKTRLEKLKKHNAILETRDSTVRRLFAEELRLGSARMLRRLQVERKCDQYGAQVLVRLRTVCFRFTKHLVSARMHPTEYRNKCACCRKHVEEDVWHFIIECTPLSIIRESITP
ncbi:hypothetical protein EDEG_00824 [Edhazardia aedis USNM 41457]|uniref:Uncharacterized protein n=1 Tax=Edhazardia aedis (strain USNM 41457) TaxID=1003232 RepID=J8ZZI3_EDHAE|nr:hypothetical protein EDEG_00824 [Edhazardia aedis USNM 41457]|eukprot:EJW05043.1 hypothetical protein EDEG_00824 [Edhazardia aedis USNM 41457]